MAEAGGDPGHKIQTTRKANLGPDGTGTYGLKLLHSLPSPVRDSQALAATQVP